jgi:hypothetical protein
LSEKRTAALILGGAALFVSVLGCIGIGAFVFAVKSWDWEGTGEPIAGPADPNDPFAPIAPLGGQPPTPPDTSQLRSRYRPGPHVRVEGALPTGRLEVQRIERGARQGRTVDTPWIVGGAELLPEAAPGASTYGSGAPTLRLTDEGTPLTIVAGVPAMLPLRTEPGAGENGSVRGLLLAFHDYPGHFFLPATVDTELGHVEVAGVEEATVHFGIDAAVLPDGSAIAAEHEVTMYVAVVDVEGRVSDYATRQLRLMPVGQGDVEVTLTMGQATDLDLYVVDSTGTTVYYGNTESFTGGHLDLDANAACSGNMGVNTEHVYWPQGGAPAGTYTVRVAHFESCVGDAPVDYRVTVRNCGETVVLAGRFSGPADTTSCDTPPGDANPSWCQQVVEFEVTPCSGGAPAPVPAGGIHL